MCRGGIKVVIELLDVFSMISFVARDTKQAFFEDRIDTVPKCECETEALVVIRYSCYTIFAPPICARARLGMREVSPSITVRGIILSDSRLREGIRSINTNSLSRS